MRILWIIGLIGVWLWPTIFVGQTPDDIAGLEVWLRADELSVDGSEMTWNDLSPNDINAVQNISASHPTLVADNPFIDNQPYALFDGADDHLLINNSIEVGSVFVVLNYTEPSGNFENFDGVLTGQAGGNDQIVLIGNSGSTNFFSSGIFGSNLEVNGEPTVNFAPTSQWKIVRGSSANSQQLNNMVIGRDRSSSARSWKGGIAEIIIYSEELDETDAAIVSAYLKDRYTPEITLQPNYLPTDFCPLDIDAGTGFLAYSWSDASESQVNTIDTSGTFLVSVISTFGDTLTGETEVNYPGNFITSFELCAGQDSLWSTNLSNDDFNFVWQDDSEESSLLINAAGTYQVLVEDLEGCSFLSEPVEVTLDDFSIQEALQPISEICQDGVLSTSLEETDELDFSWSTGSTESQTLIEAAGTVSVSITNQNGCVLTDQTEVEIAGISPIAAFSADYLCVDQEISFTDLSETLDGSDIVFWDWSFFESGESDEQNPAQIFPDAGIYSVTLSVETDSGCAAQTEQEVLVPSTVMEDIQLSNNCAGYSTSVTNQPTIELDSILSVEWIVSDQDETELASGTGSDFSLQVENPGVYTLAYTYLTDSGCVEQISTPIEIVQSEFCYTPDTINALTFWLAADSLVEANAGQVSLWGNISDTTYNAEAMSVDVPELVEDIPEINSKSAIRMNSASTWMTFNQLSSIRTMVFLIKHQSGNQDGFPTLFGHMSQTDFVGANGTDLFLPGVAAPELFNGLGRINGDTVEVAEMIKPVQYAIHSFLATDSLIAEFLSKDRNFTNRGWLGDFVEILMFDEFLAVDEIEQVEQYLRYKYAPPVNLPPSIEIPYGFCDLEISAHEAFYTDYHWNTGSTDSAITVNESGTYEVSVTDIFGYTSSDSVVVTYPADFLGEEMMLCQGDAFVYNTELSEDNYQFNWSTGDTTSAINITQEGGYSLTVLDTNGCSYEAPILTISIDSFPANFGILYPPTFCEGNALQLLPDDELIVSQVWSTGDTTSSINPGTEGGYWVEALNEIGCVGQDTVDVEFVGIAPLTQYDSGTLCEETAISFSDESEAPGGATIIESTWYLGGDTLQGVDVDFTFPEPGNYSLKLQVLTDAGCTGSLEETIYVNPIPQIDFEFSLACSNQTTLFEDQSTIVQGSIANWYWDFGGGNTADTPEANTDFDEPGIFQVELGVESAVGCLASTQFDVPVYPTPEAQFDWSPTCEGDLMLFESTTDTGLTGPLNYAWNLAGVVNSGSSIQHEFSGSGTYEVSHEVWTTIAGSPGCFDEVIQEVVVSEPPNVLFEHSIACAGQNFMLMDATEPGANDTVTSWYWSTPGSLIDTLSNISFVFDEVGTYSVILEVETEAGCEGAYFGTVEVGSSESPEIEFSPEIGLPPLEVEFVNTTSIGQGHAWYFGDGSNSVLESPIHTYTDTGFFHVEVIVFDDAGCFGSDTATVMVIEPFFDVSVESVTCELQDGQLAVSCVIGNYNNHRLTNAELRMSLGNGTTVSEYWEGNLPKNQLTTFSFQSELNYDPEINDSFVCVEITNPNGSPIDMVPENNEICKPFGDGAFEVFNPFPNPAADNVTLFFSLERSAQLTIQLVQSDGRVLEQREAGYAGGLNKVQFNTEALSAGVYLIGVEWNDQWHWRKLLIRRN